MLKELQSVDLSSVVFDAVRPLDDMALNILQKRYYHVGESQWSDVVSRVTNWVCKEDAWWKPVIYDMMLHRYFIPNSPCLVNSGKKNGGLSACFVVGFEDSIEEIYKTKLEFALIAKKGGGCGTTLSNLRPENDFVSGSTHGYAGGPVKFFETICNDMKAMTQAGFREMAMMGVMYYKHPDIIKFIKAKIEEGRMHTTNISVAVDAEFMELVKSDGTYWTEFKGVRYSEIRARELFDMIVDGAWSNGEPGIIFLDRMNDSPYTYSGQKIEATNPCVSAGTLVNTPSGYIPVENIKVGDNISTVFGTEKVKSVESHEDIPVFKVSFSDGGFQYVTSAHRYYAIKSGSSSKRLSDYRLDELSVGDYVRVGRSSLSNLGSDDDYVRGLKSGILLGDGCYTHINGDSGVISIASNQDDVDYNSNVHNLFGITNLDWKDKKSKSMSMYVGSPETLLCELGLETGYSYNKSFDIKRVVTIREAIGILDGLLATDGNINLRSNHPQIRWDTTSPELAQNIRRLLLMIGCHGRISTSTDMSSHMLGNREIVRNHAKMTIGISGDSISNYIEHTRIEEINPEKGKTLVDLRKYWMTTGNTWKARIKSIEEYGLTTVYDLYCDGSDTWITDGYVQRGCGEQPLPKNGVCNLGSLDLSKFVEFGIIDWNKLEIAVRVAARFLDAVIDAGTFPTRDIAEWVKSNRPTGLGVMGAADLLLSMGVAYGSEESLSIIGDVMKFISDVADRESEEMGREMGIPEACLSLPVPRRNITTTSIAPTGTISLIAGCSNGIEPIFSEFTMREDKTGTYKIYHPMAHQPHFRCAVTGNGGVEVTWQEHVQMQNVVQNHVNSGVSKTINFPNSATKEDVASAFMMAYDLGSVKGMTVYRNGSRNQEVLSPKKINKDKRCPECGGNLVKEGGCTHCDSCEYSFCEVS